MLTASACSSSGSSTASTPGSTASGGATAASGAAAAGGTPVQVGIVCSCSGPFGSTVGAGGDTAQAWAKSVNAAGGIQGHQVNVTFKDDASNPGTALTDAQALISAHVDVILDLDVLDATWEKAADAAKIPVVGGNFSSGAYYTDPNWYPSGQTQDSVVVSDVATLKAAGAKRVGQLYCAESPSCAQGVAPRKAAAQAIGLTDVYDASFSTTAPNYTAQCLAAKQSNVAGMHVGGAAASVVNVAQDCATTSALANSLWAGFPALPYFADTPAVKAMDAAVDQYYPNLRSNKNEWSEYALQAWTGGLLIEDAVKGAGLGASAAVTPDAVTTGLNSIKNDTLDGLAPPLTFTAGKPHPVSCWYTARLLNGKPTLVDGGKLTCENGSGS
jgi:branched-chain amino acid transport system substrate-binding protein